MAHEIIMPKFGQQTETSTVITWHRKEGDTVAKGDVLLEIQTDKAALEVESFFSGTLLKIFAREGDELPVMSVIGYIGEPGEKVPDAPPAPKAAPAPVAAPAAPARKAVPARPQPAGKPEPAAAPAAVPAVPGRFMISPRAKKLAADSLIDATRVRGSGAEGMVTERDVRAYLDDRGYKQLVVAPAARELIGQKGLDVFDIRGTGDNGRITCEDVERALAEQPRPMPPMRRIIAQRMTESVTTMPQFFVTMRVDMTDLLEFRKEARRERGVKASVGDFIMKAVALTLREMPVVNSVCLGSTYRVNQDVNIGMAVALDDGLVVPVVRCVDALSLNELAEKSKDLAARARDKKLLPDELAGGTFTISNMGMLGVHQFTAIVNPGEGAILAVGGVVETPVVKAGQVVVRSLMHMTLSSDHRIIDGAVAAQFMKAVREKIEDTGLWQKMA